MRLVGTVSFRRDQGVDRLCPATADVPEVVHCGARGSGNCGKDGGGATADLAFCGCTQL